MIIGNRNSKTAIVVRFGSKFVHIIMLTSRLRISRESAEGFSSVWSEIGGVDEKEYANRLLRLSCEGKFKITETAKTFLEGLSK